VRALVLNCTLKPSPAESNTEAPAKVVIEALKGQGVTTELVRVADYDVRPGVSCDEGHDWSASTGEAAAGNLVAVARALQVTPMPAPAGS
jgi:multimeric flavodoxin WrbA